MTPKIYAQAKSVVARYLCGQTGLKVLDVGSMDVNGTYKDLFVGSEYIGLDIAPGKNVDVVAKDPYRWDFPSNTFDFVVSGSTFEHIEYPWETIAEIARVMKKDAYVYLDIPSYNWAEHRFPIDCWRVFMDGMVALAKWANLTVIENRTYAHNDSVNCIMVAQK